jgi:hypothetical protein
VGLLMEPAVFLLPGLGLLASTGPIGAEIVGALGGAVSVGGLSSLGSALTQLGLSHDQAMRYATASKADMHVMAVQGSATDEDKIRLALSDSNACSLPRDLPASIRGTPSEFLPPIA